MEIFSDELIAEALAFRGGTALHKVVLAEPLRYSEDIDLVRTSGGPAGAILDALRARLDPWLGVPKRERKETSVKLVYRFESEIAPVVPLRLKVEINTREHEAVLPRVRVPFAVTSPWFTGRTEIQTFALPELLGTKLRALYQRKKGRDLFDFAVTLDRLEDDEVRDVVRCFLHYLGRGGHSVSRAELEENLAGKRSDPAFGADVRPLLVPGTEDRSRACPRPSARAAGQEAARPDRDRGPCDRASRAPASVGTRARSCRGAADRAPLSGGNGRSVVPSLRS